MMRCPACEEMVEIEHFACKSGSKGGKAGTGTSKARTSDQARAAANARWGKKVVPLREVIMPRLDEDHLSMRAAKPAADAALSSVTPAADSSAEKISGGVGLSGNDPKVDVDALP